MPGKFQSVAELAVSIGLAAVKMTIPDVLTALGSAAVGALAGLLASSPVGK